MNYSDYIAVKAKYHDGLKEELERYIAGVTSSSFDDDTWVFEKHIKSAGHLKHNFTIYFADANQKIFKYYATVRLISGASVATVSGNVTSIGVFVRFLKEKYPGITLQGVNRQIIAQYERYVSRHTESKGTKEALWTAIISFFHDMRGWKELPNQPPLGRNNPFSRTTSDRKLEGKYVPECIIGQLDVKFRDDRLPLERRLIYWIARSIPSRITEVTGMSLDCLKPYKNKWVLIMPTWKQNGGYLEPQLRRIYMKYEGHGMFLIDMIREQQKISRDLQHLLPENKKGMLFTYRQKVLNHNKQTKTGEIEYVLYGDKIIIPNSAIVGKWFRNLKKWQIKDENGTAYVITTHQLRHNGITDRVWAGFNIVEIRDMTGHQGTGMIETAYSHNVPGESQRVQKKVVNNRDNQALTSADPVFFRGRILNMDEQTEARLLKNLRAQRLGKLGICGDITNCKNNPFECFNCNDFIPNADELDYYENQVLEWTEKVKKFCDHEYMRQNAEYNLELNKKIVAKIKKALSGGQEHVKEANTQGTCRASKKH